MKWFTTFPRKIGCPNKSVCKTPEEFETMYNRMNGIVNKLYVGLYACDENGQCDEVNIDVIGHDIDWDDKYNSMVEFHNKLLKDGHQHQVMFSTGGFWVYTMVKPKVYPKAIAKGKLAAMQDYLLEGTSLKFGMPKEAPIDRAVRGDVERLTRMPSSYDKTRGRFAIFLTQEDIDSGMDNIIKLSENVNDERRFLVYTFNLDKEIALDLENVESKPIFTNTAISEFNGTDYSFNLPSGISESHIAMLNGMPKFMQQWLLNPDLGTWKARFYVTLFLKEKGLSLKQTEAFMKPFLEKMPRTDQHKNNWIHYHDVVKTAEMVYKRDDLKFPTYQTLYLEGLCSIETVDEYGPFKSPAYRSK